MIDILPLIKLIDDLPSDEKLFTINVTKSSSIILDEVEKQLFADKPFWFGIVNNHSFIYMILENIDTNVFLFNNDEIRDTPLKNVSQVFHSDALKLSGIQYSSKTLWELFTSEHIDMRELCDMTLVNAVTHTKQYLKDLKNTLK